MNKTTPTASIDIDSTRAAARRYLTQGWTPLAYAHGTKEAFEKNWSKKTRDKVDVDKDFGGTRSNIGIVLGAASDDLVDVDLDCDEAIALAPTFLPKTGKRFGRASTAEAHWLYKSAVPATVAFTTNGKKDGMIVELRSTGGQTMFPPSVHPSGERLSWAEDGDLPEVDPDVLHERVCVLALASLVLRHWRSGMRNVLGLRLPGALLTHGWTQDAVKRLIEIVATHAGDDHAAIQKSIGRVEYTVRRLAARRPCTGLPKLAETLGVSLDTLRSWIDRRPEDQRGILASVDPIYVARQFAKTLDDVWHWRGDFYRWSGSWWTLMDDEEVKGRVYPWLENVRVKERGKAVPIKATRTLVGDVLAALAGVKQLSNTTETPFWIDPTGTEPSPNRLIPFRNGVFDLNTWELRRPDQRLFSLHGVDCDYDPEAESPKWRQFMGDAFPEDKESAPCLEEILGYCITSDTSLQKAFALIGDKRSGKGTIGRILRAAVGADRFINPKLHDFSETFGAQNLIGKTVAVIADQRGTGRGAHAVENILSITGEDPQSIRRMFKSHWNGMLQTRILLLSNAATNLKDPTGVIVTRFIVINFTESFYGRENLNLTAELIAELPGIMNVWLEGYRRLRKRGHFVQPQSGLEYLDQMDENAGVVKRFVLEKCAVHPDYQVTKSLLYKEFLEWSKDHGHHAMADSTFATDLLGLHMKIRAAKAPRDAEGYQAPIWKGITTNEMVPSQAGKLTPSQAIRVFKDSGVMPDPEVIDPKIPF